MENIFRIFGEDFAKRFGKTLNPRYNLYISRMTGTINTDTLPIRDEVIGFWGFNCL